MRSVRPQLAVTVGVLSIIQMAASIPTIVLAAIIGSQTTYWGLGGGIAQFVGSLFGIIAGFGRFRSGLILNILISLTGTAFTLIAVSELWKLTQLVPSGISDIEVGFTVVGFITSVFAVAQSFIAIPAVFWRRTNLPATAQYPTWQIEEKARARIIRMNRTVAAFAILQMLCAIPVIVMTAIIAQFEAWWGFGGAIGLTVAAFFGIIAGFRARRGMHLIYSFLTLASIGITLVMCGFYFRARTFGEPLSSLQLASLSLGFIASVFAFFGAIVSIAVFFSYRRRLLPMQAAQGTAMGTTVARPQVVTAPGEAPAAQQYSGAGYAPSQNVRLPATEVAGQQAPAVIVEGARPAEPGMTNVAGRGYGAPVGAPGVRV